MTKSNVMPTFGGSQVQIKVDDQNVMDVVERVWESVSGPSLEAFLEGTAYTFLDDQIVNRFAYEGDNKSGTWAPLSDATVAIKSSMDTAMDAEQINVRTGDFFDWVVHSHDVSQGSFSAELRFPGEAPDPIMATKLEHIQMGADGQQNPIGGDTPPRPVLAVDETDLEELLIQLSEYIILSVGTNVGAASLTVNSGRGRNRQSNSMAL